jgi:hypothetical protein
MATPRDIDVALILLKNTGYPNTGRVRPEHHRLVDTDRPTNGTVTEWLNALTGPQLDGLLNRLADRGYEHPGVPDAERLLAALDHLLPGETLIVEAHRHRPHTSAYAALLDTVAADLAARAYTFLSGRHTAGLAPVTLLDTAYRAIRMLDEHDVPDVQRDPFTHPGVKAIRTAVAWMIVRHGVDTADDRLRAALKASDW